MLRKSLKLSPHEVKVWYNKAFAHMNLSEYKAADVCYDEILKMDPTHADATGDKGVVQASLGHFHDAIPFLTRP